MSHEALISGTLATTTLDIYQTIAISSLIKVQHNFSFLQYQFVDWPIARNEINQSGERADKRLSSIVLPKA